MEQDRPADYCMKIKPRRPVGPDVPVFGPTAEEKPQHGPVPGEPAEPKIVPIHTKPGWNVEEKEVADTEKPKQEVKKEVVKEEVVEEVVVKEKKVKKSKKKGRK